MAKKEMEKSKKEKKVSNKAENNNKSFFKEFKAELKRVSWPTPKQLINNTSAVVVIVLLVAVIVFVLDVVFEKTVTIGVDQVKAIVTSSSDENNGTESDSTEVVADDASSIEAGDNATDTEVNTEEVPETTQTEETTDTTEVTE